MMQNRGEEFKDDVRKPGARNADTRRQLTPQEMQPLTALSTGRSLLAIFQTLGLIADGMALCWFTWPSFWFLAGLLLIGVAQHGLFILAHDASHYRLFAHRGVNDGVGHFIGMCSGISMCTYRVTHRLHHNHLYAKEDPDTANHGGYPRGRAYLWRAARSNRTHGNWVNWLGRFFLLPHHVNYHLEHHLCVAVPHYRLPALHQLLQEKGALEGAEVRDLSSTLQLIFAPRRPREH
jgi:fatty acid desaturase